MNCTQGVEVVFVELLAYFFLKLYKSTLTSIQYYHNELTNIETRKIAAIVAIKHCKEDKIWQTVECLLKVDRNVLLKGKETTIQMEMLKMQNEYDNNMINSMKSFTMQEYLLLQLYHQAYFLEESPS